MWKSRREKLAFEAFCGRQGDGRDWQAGEGKRCDGLLLFLIALIEDAFLKLRPGPGKRSEGD